MDGSLGSSLSGLNTSVFCRSVINASVLERALRVCANLGVPVCSSFIIEYCSVWYSLHSEVDLEFVFLFRDRFLDASTSLWFFIALYSPDLIQYNVWRRSQTRSSLIQDRITYSTYHIPNAVSKHWVVKDSGTRSGLPEVQPFISRFSQVDPTCCVPGYFSPAFVVYLFVVPIYLGVPRWALCYGVLSCKEDCLPPFFGVLSTCDEALLAWWNALSRNLRRGRSTLSVQVEFQAAMRDQPWLLPEWPWNVGRRDYRWNPENTEISSCRFLDVKSSSHCGFEKLPAPSFSEIAA